MMKTFVLLVLPLGLFDSVFGNHLRTFNEHGNEKNVWNISLNICEQNNESLVTAYDAEDVKVALKIMEDGCWLGLHKKQKESDVNTWSNGESLTFSESQVNISHKNQICEAMGNRTWEGFDCSDRNAFMCYKGNNYMLIEDKKNWCQALQFCRSHYTDLVSISNKTQNEEVFKKGENKTFWIGLRHDQWTWTDNSCSTYRTWHNRATKGNCSKAALESLVMLDCSQKSKTLCTKGNVRIQIVRENHTWEQALDYCKDYHTRLLWIEDDKDQKAVEQWLNTTKDEGPFWIGLKQSILLGLWIWSDRIVGYNNWKNDKVPEMPMSNQCGAITKIEGTWKWSDENCWNPLHFLCEEEIVFL